jgi:hypothetical protein
MGKILGRGREDYNESNSWLDNEWYFSSIGHAFPIAQNNLWVKDKVVLNNYEKMRFVQCGVNNAFKYLGCFIRKPF